MDSNRKPPVRSKARPIIVPARLIAPTPATLADRATFIALDDFRPSWWDRRH